MRRAIAGIGTLPHLSPGGPEGSGREGADDGRDDAVHELADITGLGTSAAEQLDLHGLCDGERPQQPVWNIHTTVPA